MDYWDAIDYLLALPDLERFSAGAAGQTMSLDAMKALLKKLGNPERGRKTIHVTGSKGKGSTSAMIAAILHERGYKTGLFTSPHLHDYNERINFNLVPVSRFDFADAVKEIRDSIDEVNTSDLGPISTFGALLALFFHMCKKSGIEYQVVEVGLGGTNDATNVFDTKEAAVITSISLEHTELLGKTREAIAREKAGIITKGCTTIVAAQADNKVLPAVREIAEKRGSKVIDAGAKYRVSPKSHDSNGQSFVVESPLNKYDLHTMVLGVHQLQNAATAIATIEAICGTTDEDMWAIEDGLGSVELPGRLEQLTRHPLVVVDGAHNADSMEALVGGLERHFDYEEVIVVIGANSDKNMAAMLDHIKTLKPKALIATRSSSPKAMAPEDIAKAAEKLGLTVHTTQKVEDALDVVRKIAKDNDLVCITGSLYVVGEARQSILSLPVTH